MIKALLTSLLVLNFTAATQAQFSHRDSVIKVAVIDVRNFRLDKAAMKRFRDDRRNPNSDLFKPFAANVSDVTLLQDSVYVKAFRQVAWQKTGKRRTAWHYAWVSLAVYDGIYVVLLLGVFITGHGANLR